MKNKLSIGLFILFSSVILFACATTVQQNIIPTNWELDVLINDELIKNYLKAKEALVEAKKTEDIKDDEVATQKLSQVEVALVNQAQKMYDGLKSLPEEQKKWEEELRKLLNFTAVELIERKEFILLARLSNTHLLPGDHKLVIEYYNSKGKLREEKKREILEVLKKRTRKSLEANIKEGLTTLIDVNLNSKALYWAAEAVGISKDELDKAEAEVAKGFLLPENKKLFQDFEAEYAIAKQTESKDDDGEAIEKFLRGSRKVLMAEYAERIVDFSPEAKKAIAGVPGIRYEEESQRLVVNSKLTEEKKNEILEKEALTGYKGVIEKLFQQSKIEAEKQSRQETPLFEVAEGEEGLYSKLSKLVEDVYSYIFSPYFDAKSSQFIIKWEKALETPEKVDDVKLRKEALSHINQWYQEISSEEEKYIKATLINMYFVSIVYQTYGSDNIFDSDLGFLNSVEEKLNGFLPNARVHPVVAILLELGKEEGKTVLKLIELDSKMKQSKEKNPQEEKEYEVVKQQFLEMSKKTFEDFLKSSLDDTQKRSSLRRKLLIFDFIYRSFMPVNTYLSRLEMYQNLKPKRPPMKQVFKEEDIYRGYLEITPQQLISFKEIKQWLDFPTVDDPNITFWDEIAGNEEKGISPLVKNIVFRSILLLEAPFIFVNEGGTIEPFSQTVLIDTLDEKSQTRLPGLILAGTIVHETAHLKYLKWLREVSQKEGVQIDQLENSLPNERYAFIEGMNFYTQIADNKKADELPSLMAAINQLVYRGIVRKTNVALGYNLDDFSLHTEIPKKDISQEILNTYPTKLPDLTGFAIETAIKEAGLNQDEAKKATQELNEVLEGKRVYKSVNEEGDPDPTIKVIQHLLKEQGYLKERQEVYFNKNEEDNPENIQVADEWCKNKDLTQDEKLVVVKIVFLLEDWLLKEQFSEVAVLKINRNLKVGDKFFKEIVNIFTFNLPGKVKSIELAPLENNQIMVAEVPLKEGYFDYNTAISVMRFNDANPQPERKENPHELNADSLRLLLSNKIDLIAQKQMTPK